jgi:hypothetical protein
MTIQFSIRSIMSAWVLVTLTYTVNATALMVGQPVERPGAHHIDSAPPSAPPVVVGSEPAAPARATEFPTPPKSPPQIATSAPQSTAPVVERLSIQAGQRLSVALSNWLNSQNISLSWEPAGTLPGRVRDVVIESTWSAKQVSLEQSLAEVLAPFGLTAHVLRQGASEEATSIVVRNTSNSRP